MPLSDIDRQTLIGDGSSRIVDNTANMAVMQGSYEDPDAFAHDVRLAKEANLPLDVVRHDMPEAKRQAGLNKMDVKALLGESPKLNEWLKKNPDNAKLSFDDLPQLAEIERQNTRRPWYDLSIRDFEGLADSMSIGMAKTGDAAMLGFYSQAQELDMQMINKYRREGRDDLADELMRVKGDRIKERQYQINKRLASLGVAEEEIARLTPEDLTIMGEGFRGGFQVAADMAPGLAVSWATGGRVNPTLTLLTTKAGLQSYGSARLEGREHGEAMLYGGIDAALELLTEKIPTKYAEDLFTKIGTGDMKTTVGKFLVGDVAGEQVAEFTQTLNAVAFELDEELANAKDLNEMIRIQGERQIVTAIATLVGGGGISGAGMAADRYATREQRKNRVLLKNLETRVQSEAADEWLENQIFLAQSSKVSERSKEAFTEYMENLDPETRVFINPDAFKDIQEIPDVISEQMDGTGADISLPLATFLTDIVPNDTVLEAVRQHVKVQADFLTRNEMENNYDSDQAKAMIKAAEKHKEAKTEADMIYQQVKEQIVGTRRQGEATAKFSAELIPAYIVTKQAELADRGIDVGVKELYEKMGFQVIGPAQAPDLREASKVLEQQEDAVPTMRGAQKLGDLTITQKGTDEAGNVVEVKQKAQQLWNNQQKRIKMVEKLRLCVSG